MPEGKSTPKKRGKPVPPPRKRRRLYEAISAEDEGAVARAVEEETTGKKAPRPEKTREQQDSEKEREARDVIRTYVGKVGAIAVIPIPGFDLAAVVIRQTEMLRKLADIYDVTYDDSLAQEVIRKVWKAYDGLAMGGMFFGSAAKMVPFFGSIMGMGPVAVAAARSTRALGELVVEENRRSSDPVPAANAAPPS